MSRVDEAEVLLLWRAVANFRSGARPACRARGHPPRSECPLYERCPRWSEPDDRQLSMSETFDQAERRRASWPCTRLLDLLGPGTRSIASGG